MSQAHPSAESNTHAALVTGGAGGIGRAVAEALLARGDAVMVVDLPRAGSAAVSAAGAAVNAADLTASGACADAVAATAARFGRVDILVNNASVQHVADLARFPKPSGGTCWI